MEQRKEPSGRVLPPTPTNPPLEDDDSPTPTITFSETSEALHVLAGIADLLRTCSPDELDPKTVEYVGWLMYEIAEAGHACWNRERDEWKREAEADEARANRVVRLQEMKRRKKA